MVVASARRGRRWLWMAPIEWSFECDGCGKRLREGRWVYFYGVGRSLRGRLILCKRCGSELIRCGLSVSEWLKASLGEELYKQLWGR